MDYKILSGKDSDELQRKVQNALDHGWSPCGGIAFDTRSGELYQAVTSSTDSRVAAARARDY